MSPDDDVSGGSKAPKSAKKTRAKPRKKRSPVPEIEPGHRKDFRLRLLSLDRFSRMSIPAVIVRGLQEGPRLAVSAAVHGDELNGIEIARRLTADIDPSDLAGSILALPAVNVMGVLHGNRYMPDGRDLNREFPGSPKGSFTRRVAKRIFDVLATADAHIDLHTGTRGRTNLPHVRADLSNRDIAELARAFGTTTIYDKSGNGGTLRGALSSKGVPSIIYEGGQAHMFEEHAIEVGLRGVHNVMRHLGMLPGDIHDPPIRVELNDAHWVRTSKAGLMEIVVKPGDVLSEGDLIARNVSVFGHLREEIRADTREVVLGLATNPLAMPGAPVAHLLEFEDLTEEQRDYLEKVDRLEP